MVFVAPPRTHENRVTKGRSETEQNTRFTMFCGRAAPRRPHLHTLAPAEPLLSDSLLHKPQDREDKDKS